jgi:hypothetical protein
MIFKSESNHREISTVPRVRGSELVRIAMRFDPKRGEFLNNPRASLE